MSLATLLARQRFAVLDGGLATELERRGADLRDALWSARLLLDAPALIRDVHLDYFRAGADVAVTATYQASFPSLARRGLDGRQTEQVLRLAVRLAVEARERFLEEEAAGEEPARTVAPLVAASIGPYGAYLHDGSEYRGEYGLTDRELKAFHRERLTILAEGGVDLLACETIPSRREAEVLVDLLERRGDVTAWISFTGRDERRIADGTPFVDCVQALAGAGSVVAIGVNCTPPPLIAPLLQSAAGATERPFVVYPNGGGSYDAGSGRWHGDSIADSIPERVPEWWNLGARLIGGCCRTTPATIREIRLRLGSGELGMGNGDRG